MSYHEDGTTCSFLEDYERDVLALEKEIDRLTKIQKMLVNHLDWDSLDYGELEIARELHIKYYPDKPKERQ